MVKDPVSKMVINRDSSNYELLKLRRSQLRIEKKLHNEISNLSRELIALRDDLKKTLNRETNG